MDDIRDEELEERDPALDEENEDDELLDPDTAILGKGKKVKGINLIADDMEDPLDGTISLEDALEEEEGEDEDEFFEKDNEYGI